MNVLSDNWDLIRDGFFTTLELTVLCGLVALVGGTLLAACRVSPVPPLRWFGTAYVNVVRNTPLTLIMLVVGLGFPKLNIHFSFITFAVIAVGGYTAAFICEAVRSGINTVPIGQAEAARSLGMSFTQVLTLVVLPQALRAVVPPIGSLLIAMVRNSAIASAFNVHDLFGTSAEMVENGENVLLIFLWIAIGYLLITLTMSALFAALEKKLAVAR
ncbi:MAG: amino acid ABC transporter permease [Streptomycetaceae bacterium]|uniref:amino acid ABC transporter permease n=1 Tax=Uniformispora flossi TaxID=3390723 RepID=UPI0018061975|nr:amino acid ABC transporter permease [Streptomycetaceae bacterium]NUR27595.1 amino acid ABC transporter permease [Catenulispora sp.]NUS53976.1 amino acid ABC transporter permease [Streptomycetaceae bacterium]